jgi:hypothetical protein
MLPATQLCSKFLATLLLTAVILISSCQMVGYSVEQEVRAGSPRTLCPSGSCFVTYVWHNGEILQAWYDDAIAIPDSMPSYRRRQADSLIAKLKK